MKKLDLLINVKHKLLAESFSFFLTNSQVLKNKFELRVDITPKEQKVYDLIIFDKSALRECKPEEFSVSKKLLLDDGLLEEETIFLFLYYKLSGILPYDMSLELLCKCFEVVLKGEVWISKNLIKKICENYNNFSTKKGFEVLTSQERKIVNLIYDGFTNKEIAVKLSISEQTVKAHLNHIFKKIGIKSRNQLIKLYFSVMGKEREQINQETSIFPLKPIKKVLKLKKT